MTATFTATRRAGYDVGDKSYGLVLEMKWEGIGDDETTSSYECAGFADKTVQVIGTVGAGTVTIQGSNDGTNFVALTDGIGNSLAFSAVGIKLIGENPRYIRVVTDSGSSNDVDVIVYARLA